MVAMGTHWPLALCRAWERENHIQGERLASFVDRRTSSRNGTCAFAAGCPFPKASTTRMPINESPSSGSRSADANHDAAAEESAILCCPMSPVGTPIPMSNAAAICSLAGRCLHSSTKNSDEVGELAISSRFSMGARRRREDNRIAPPPTSMIDKLVQAGRVALRELIP